jgi:putative transposase
MKAIKESLVKNIEHFLEYDKKNAIENVVKSVFETILKLERSEFLKNSTEPSNKANGYYQRLARSVNQYIQINVPRDRLSEFKPVFLDAINQYDSQLLDLSFKLYTHGLTTEDIKKIMDDIFGKKISTSSISNIMRDFQTTREAWLARPVEDEYYFIFIDALWIPVRRDNVSKEAFYIVLGLRKDLKREVLGVYNIPVESYPLNETIS